VTVGLQQLVDGAVAGGAAPGASGLLARDDKL
jgi:hypothetical protein